MKKPIFLFYFFTLYSFGLNQTSDETSNLTVDPQASKQTIALNIATTSVEQLIDYCMNTSKDRLISSESVKVRNEPISRNLDYINKNKE
jgi:hypothetical protein